MGEAARNYGAQVRVVRGACDVVVQDNYVEKKHKVAGTYKIERDFWKLAMELGVAPSASFADADGDPYIGVITSERMTPLDQFISKRGSIFKAELATKIAIKLKLLSENGIAHRDVHIKNIVVNDEAEPFLIDWEFATETESKISYDLYGEHKSKVQRPKQHTKSYPIYWDYKGNRSLGHFLMPLKKVKGF